ncbi:DUF7446 family protein [Undibacterium sp. MH2W]|uniref:DUF7446 family protein n=1 Tax=Undibacterium sp. MH2W TaxID=3413044 RepID=UPI003BF16D45
MTQAISCSPLTKRIRIGTLNKAGTMYVGKLRDVTSECVGSIIEMIGDNQTHQVTVNGVVKYEITVTKIAEE